MRDKITVLVIDDDITIRTLLKSTLTNKGFNVVCADNGPQGLKLAASNDTDVILLDWLMPGMDGIEVLSELKRGSDTSHIPVIMLTCKENATDIDLATKKGAIDYIVKPFSAFQVPEIVQKHLENLSGKNKRKNLFCRLLGL